MLPATMFPEHADVYCSYGHRRAQFARPACKPPPGPRSNVHAFATIARINCLVSTQVSDLGNGNVLYSTRVNVLPAP